MKKFLVGAAVGTAGLVALTGATFAQTEGDSPGTGVRERVAEILGVAPEELQDAVQQARGEHQDEQIAERLASAVEEGVITQDEADAISGWLDSMPDALEGLAGHGRQRGFGNVIGAADSEERIAALVERLVEAGKITQEDVAAVTEWFGDAPTEVLSKLGRHDGDRAHGRGFRGRMFGEGPGGRLFEGRFQIRPYVPPVDADSAEESSAVSSVAVGEVA